MEENQQSTAQPTGNSMMPIIMVIVVIIVAAGGYFFATRNKAQKNTEVPTQTTQEPTKGESGATMEEQTKDNPSKAMEEKGAAKEFTVSGDSFSFDLKKITVKKGDTVKIIFKNTEGFHDWVVDEFDARTKQIPAGGTDSVEFVADKAGTFEYYCSVGNHRAKGMVGTLTVEE